MNATHLSETCLIENTQFPYMYFFNAMHITEEKHFEKNFMACLKNVSVSYPT